MAALSNSSYNMKSFTIEKTLDGSRQIFSHYTNRIITQLVIKIIIPLDYNDTEASLKRKINEELNCNFHTIQSHPYIVKLKEFTIDLKEQKNSAICRLYYQGHFLPINQFLSEEKQSTNKIHSFIYKLCKLMDDLSQMEYPLQMCYWNVWVDEKGDPAIIFPPYSLIFNRNYGLDQKKMINRIIPFPYELPESNLKAYYSFIFGYLLVAGLLNGNITKVLEPILERQLENAENNSKNSKLSQLLKKSIISNSPYSSKLIELIINCISANPQTQLPIGKACKFLENLVINHDEAVSTKFEIIEASNYLISYNKESLIKIKNHCLLNHTLSLRDFSSNFSVIRTKMTPYPRNKTETDLDYFLGNLNSMEKLRKKSSLDIRKQTFFEKGNRISKDSSSNHNTDSNSPFQIISEGENCPFTDNKVDRIYNNTCRLDHKDRSTFHDYLKELYKNSQIKEEINSVRAEDIINQKLAINNDEISFFKTLDLFKEKYQEKIDQMIERLSIILKQLYAGGSTLKGENRIPQIYNNNFNHESLNSFNFGLNFSENQELENTSNNHIYESEKLNPFRASSIIYDFLKNQNATKEAFKALSNSAYVDLRDLDLSNERDSNLFKEVLKINIWFRALIINQFDLKNLVLDGKTKFLEDDVKTEMFQTIQQNSGLKELFLDNINLENKNICFAGSILDKMELSSLGLMKCNLNSLQSVSLFSAIKSCLNITSLNLSDNKIIFEEEEAEKGKSFSLFQEALSNLNLIEMLALNHCGITAFRFKWILEALKHKMNFKELFIASNIIENEGAKELNKYSNLFENLTSLDISDNSLSLDSQFSIIEFISNKKLLESLRICKNKISFQGLLDLLKNLENKKSFSDLGIGNSEISRDNLKILLNYANTQGTKQFLSEAEKETVNDNLIIQLLNSLRPDLPLCILKELDYK